MAPEGSLPCSQDHMIGSYAEPDESCNWIWCLCTSSNTNESHLMQANWSKYCEAVHNIQKIDS
jgi:hypothetical protein